MTRGVARKAAARGAAVCGGVLAAGAVLLACRGSGPPPGKDQPPPPRADNVVLISADTLRADRLNAYGYAARVVSPHLDALAREGILFENHISAAPWTPPAHMSLLTSLPPSAHGVTSSFQELRGGLAGERFFDKLPESRLTLAEALREHGYATAAFTGGMTLHPKLGFEQGFSTYDTSMYKLHEDSLARLLEWVDRQQERPFFLFWHTFEVHAPYLDTSFLPEVLPPASAARAREAVARYAARFAEGRASGARLVEMLERRGLLKREVCEALYDGGVRSLDAWVGRFLQGLRERGLYDRTLIVFTSDHGDELGDHAPDRIYDSHGKTLYEEILRVPLILKLPGQRHAGARVSAVSRAVDVMPTVLELLSVRVATHQMQGSSLRTAWEDPGTESTRVAFGEATEESYEKKGLRTDRYKYIVSIDPGTVARHGRRYLPPEPAARELYDLRSDPGEKQNLLAPTPSPEAARLASAFEDALRKHLAEQRGQAEKVKLDAQTIDQLKALGYVH